MPVQGPIAPRPFILYAGLRFIFYNTRDRQDSSKNIKLYNFKNHTLAAKTTNRTRIGIINDIVNVLADSGNNGSIASNIALISNVSYTQCVEICEMLRFRGLVIDISTKKNRIYKLAWDGLKLKESIESFIETLSNYKLDALI